MKTKKKYHFNLKLFNMKTENQSVHKVMKELKEKYKNRKPQNEEEYYQWLLTETYNDPDEEIEE